MRDKYIPKISIIVPNYNHGEYLPLRLDSIFKQTYQDFEVILLDDCSTDNSRVILEQYRDHHKVSHLIYNEINSGTSYKQWYKGIGYAQGELIWIAESDDWCDEMFLEYLVPHFDDSKLTLAFCNSQYVFSNKDIKKEERKGNYTEHDGNMFIKKEMLKGNSIYNASMTVFRKKRYDEVKDNGYVNLKLCGDWLLWIQIINNSKLIEYHDKMNFLRRHGENTVNRYRAVGLDFIEGIDVVKQGANLLDEKIENEYLYKSWYDRYVMYSEYFKRGIKQKVLLKIFIFDSSMFYYIIMRIIKPKAKKVLRISS